MADPKADFETQSERVYQAYGLNGRYSEDFDLAEIARLFRRKYGYPPKDVIVVAGGGTCLAGPID